MLRYPSSGSSNQASTIVHHQPFNRDLSTSEANTVQYTQHQADPVYSPPSPQYTAAKMYHQQNSFSSDAASTPSSPSTPHTSFWPPPSSTANGNHEMQTSGRGVYQPSAFIMEPPANFDANSFPYAPGAASLTARCKLPLQTALSSLFFVVFFYFVAQVYTVRFLPVFLCRFDKFRHQRHSALWRTLNRKPS